VHVTGGGDGLAEQRRLPDPDIAGQGQGGGVAIPRPLQHGVEDSSLIRPSDEHSAEW
jgi:hypothetical protein